MEFVSWHAMTHHVVTICESQIFYSEDISTYSLRAFHNALGTCSSALLSMPSVPLPQGMLFHDLVYESPTCRDRASTKPYPALPLVL